MPSPRDAHAFDLAGLPRSPAALHARRRDAPLKSPPWAQAAYLTKRDLSDLPETQLFLPTIFFASNSCIVWLWVDIRSAGGSQCVSPFHRFAGPEASMTVLRVLTVVIVAFSVVRMAAFFSIDILWSADMPHQPDATSGRTIEVIVNHGDHVFVSEKELARKSILDSVLFPLSLAAFFGVVALNRKYRLFSKSPDRGTARRP